MKKRLAILTGKTVAFLGKIFRRGSVLPGYFALKIDKNILTKFKLPKLVIVVTGSSGKTSTSYTIAHILKENGYKVAHNKGGANLLNGLVSLLVTHSKLNGVINSDAFVMEMDERYTKELLPYVKPNYLVICNITRDQPPRQGHFDYVFDIIKSGITDKMHLILNGDDPLVNKFAFNHKGKVSYFGLCKNNESFKNLTSNSLDMVYCPLCDHKLNYNFVSFGNVGEFYCSHCSFKKPPLDYQVTNIDNGVLTINNKNEFRPKSDILYTYYNYIASFAVASLVGIDDEKIIRAMENIDYHEKRYSHFHIDEREGFVLSGKNENAPSYNQALNYVGAKEDKKTIIFGFEYISLRYPYKDLSWLYDIDFELIKNDKVDSVVCIGPFAYDIATRIYLAGIDENKIIIQDKIDGIYKTLTKTKGNIYAVLNLGTDKKFINDLKKANVGID